MDDRFLGEFLKPSESQNPSGVSFSTRKSNGFGVPRF